MKVNVITKTLDIQDSQYNQFTIDINKDGKVSMYYIDFAEKIIDGRCENIDDIDDISSSEKFNLGDGDKYAEVYINGIEENTSEYFHLETYLEDVGCHLDNVIYRELSNEEEKDRDDKRENEMKEKGII